MFSLKIILTNQADILKFKNVKRKLYNCNTSIHFVWRYEVQFFIKQLECTKSEGLMLAK